MDYSIRQESVRHVAGFHLVGPLAKRVPQGFEQLGAWAMGHQVPAREWLAVYYDNPDEVPAEKLRCATVVTVEQDFTLPPGSEGIIRSEIAAGDYAVATARVVNNDFSTPWMAFIESLMQDAVWSMAEKPCFENYLNDGRDGCWDIEMYVAVVRKNPQ